MNERHIFNFVLVGDSAVGKTNLLASFTKDGRSSADIMPTIGMDFGTIGLNKTISGTTHNILVKIWDTAGQERFRTMTSNYYKRADGIIFVYDITDQKSFDDIVVWLADVRKTLGTDLKDKNVALMLIGNKTDLYKKRVISRDVGESLADKNNMLFAESSARTGAECDEIMTIMTGNALSYKLAKSEQSVQSIKLDDEVNVSKKQCCAN